MRHRDPGKHLHPLIDPHAPAPKIAAGELQMLLETLAEGLKRWDVTTAPATDLAVEDAAGEDIRALMSESMAKYAEIGIRVEYRTP